MAKLRHIAIVTEPDNIDRLAAFYSDVFGMTITQRYAPSPTSGGGVFMTDGYMQVALLTTNPIGDGARADLSAPRKKGINHFGFTLDDDEVPGVYEKLKKYGVELFQPPEARPYVEDAFLDIDGNKVDLTTSVLRSKQEVMSKREQPA